MLTLPNLLPSLSMELIKAISHEGVKVQYTTFLVFDCSYMHYTLRFLTETPAKEGFVNIPDPTLIFTYENTRLLFLINQLYYFVGLRLRRNLNGSCSTKSNTEGRRKIEAKSQRSPGLRYIFESHTPICPLIIMEFPSTSASFINISKSPAGLTTFTVLSP